MANGDIIQRFVKKPKENKKIDENIEANGNISVTGDVAVTGTITGNVTGNVTGNADTATHANTADGATTAGSATNDANGDKIDETYLKLAGGTVTGNMQVDETLKAKFFTPMFYTLDLSSLSTSNFYPITFPKDEVDLPLDCEIHSPNLGGSATYNQNVIHFRLLTSGWTDAPMLFNVYEYGAFSFDEITIGSIGRSNNGTGGLKEGECIWLRGGMEYRFISNFKPVLHSSDYSPAGTSGVTYSVGTAYSGGTNSGVTVIFTPKTTLTANGSYFSNGGGKFNGTATNAITAISATKASQNVGGQDLTTLYPRAGCMGASSFDNVGSGGKLQRSGLYAENIGNTWYNLINVRHRNGESDGVSYGLQIRSAFSSSANTKLSYRSQSNGTWSGWRNLQQEPINLYNNASGATGTVTLSQSAANFNYLEIYYKDSKQGFFDSVRIYSPNGKDATLNVNSGLDASTERRNMAIRRISTTTISKYVTDKVVQNTAVYNVTEMAIVRVDGWV